MTDPATSEQIAAILADRPCRVGKAARYNYFVYKGERNRLSTWTTEAKAKIEAARLNAEHQQAQFEKLIAAEKAPLVEALRVAVEVMESVDGANDCSRGVSAAEAALEKVGTPATGDQTLWPDDLTPELTFILGRPNFWCGPIAHHCQAHGAAIPRKAEAEQAFVIHLMLKLWFRHGAQWADYFDEHVENVGKAGAR